MWKDTWQLLSREKNFRGRLAAGISQQHSAEVNGKALILSEQASALRAVLACRSFSLLYYNHFRSKGSRKFLNYLTQFQFRNVFG